MRRFFSTQNGNRPLAPAFINRLDKWLLLHHPSVWASRIHLFLWYALLGYALLFFIYGILPDDPRDRSNVALHQVTTGLLAGIAFLIWCIWLFRFNVFKRFGRQHPFQMLLQFLLFFMSLVLLSGTVVVPILIEKMRADQQYSAELLVTDLNDLNFCIAVLERKNYPAEVDADTLLFAEDNDMATLLNARNERYIRRKQQQEEATYADTVGQVNVADSLALAEARNWRDVRYVDIANRDELLMSSDSVVLLGDSGLVACSFLHLWFTRSILSPQVSEVPEVTTKQLYYRIYRDKKIPTDEQAWERVAAIALRYTGDTLFRYAHHDAVMQNGRDTMNGQVEYDTPEYIIQYYYAIDQINASIEHIEDRKYWLISQNHLNNILLALLYFALAGALLLTLFRYSTLRTFFVSLLVVVVLAIITGIFCALLDCEVYTILLIIAFYSVLFTSLAIAIPRARKRSLVLGVALNLSLLTVFALPITLVAAYYKRLNYLRYGLSTLDEQTYNQLLKTQGWHLELAQYAGAVLLLSLLLLFYNRMYRKWYAQPEG